MIVCSNFTILSKYTFLFTDKKNLTKKYTNFKFYDLKIILDWFIYLAKS